MAKRRFWAGILLAVLLLLVPSAALAQGGGGDKLVLGDNYVLGSGEELGGNLTVVGGNATLEPQSIVDGDVLVLGGNLIVDGTIGGDLTVWGGAVALHDGATVQHDLASFGGTVQRAPGARVEGRIVEGLGTPGLGRPFMRPFIAPDLSASGPFRRGPFDDLGRFVGWQLGTVGLSLFMALLGVVAVLLAPRHVGRIATTAGREPAMSLGLGFLTLVVALLAGGLLLIVCGLGLLVWLVAWLAILAGWVAVGLWLGQRLLQMAKMHEPSALLEVALGVFLITAITRIPWCLGFLFWLVVGSIGLGAVVLTRFGTEPYVSRRGLDGRGPEAPVLTGGAPPAPAVPGAPSVAADFVPDPPGLYDQSLAPVSPEGEAPVSAGNDAPAVRDIQAPEPETASLQAASLPLVAEETPRPVENAPVLAPVEPLDKAELSGARWQDDLDMIAGLGPVLAQRLREAGITTVSDVAASDPDTLAAATGVDVDRVRHDDWVGQARRLLS